MLHPDEPRRVSISSPLPMSEANTSTASRNSRYLNGAKFVVAIVLVVFVISRTNLEQLRGVFERLSVWGVILYFILFILTAVVKAFQYHIVIGRDVAYPRILNVVVMQNAISNFFAASAGVASYFTLFKVEHQVKVSRAMVTFVLTKVGDLIVIWCLLAISASWVWTDIGALQGLVIALLAGMGLFIGVFFLTVIYRQKISALVKIVLEKMNLLRFAPIQRGMDVLEALANQQQENVLQKMTAVVEGSFLYLVVTLAWLYAGLRIFDIHLTLGGFAFSSALYYLISYLPIQIFGGIGVTEMSLLYLYGIFSPSQAELAAVLIGLRIFSYIMNLALLLYLPLYEAYWKTPELRS